MGPLSILVLVCLTYHKHFLVELVQYVRGGRHNSAFDRKLLGLCSGPTYIEVIIRCLDTNSDVKYIENPLVYRGTDFRFSAFRSNCCERRDTGTDLRCQRRANHLMESQRRSHL